MITLQQLRKLIGKNTDSISTNTNDTARLKSLVKEGKEQDTGHTHLVTVHMHDPLTTGTQARIVKKLRVQADSDENAMSRALQYYKSKGVKKAVVSEVQSLKEDAASHMQAAARMNKKGKPVLASLHTKIAAALDRGDKVSADSISRELDQKKKTLGEEGGAGEEGTTKLTKKYKADTPGEHSENFINGKNPQDKGDMSRHGLKGKSLSQLRKVRSSDTASKRQKQLAHWYINMHKDK